MKSKYAVVATLFVLAAASVSADREGGTRGLFRLPTGAGAPSVPRVLWLAIDTRALPLRKNLTLFLTKPQVRREPVLGPSTSADAPDNVAAYCTAPCCMKAGKFRMWYYGLHSDYSRGRNRDEPGLLCRKCPTG